MSALRPERLIALREAAGLSQAELARRSGVGQSTIYRLEKGGSRNPREIFQIAEALKTTAEYLLGETENSERGVSDRLRPFRGAEVQRDPDAVEIDHVDISLGMGGAFLDSEIEVRKRRFSRAWLREITDVAPEHLAWTRGDGDSMEPTIRDGEVVLVDRSKVSPGMDDKIWAVAVGDVGMIKRLRVLPSGTVEIHSDNPHVSPATAVDGELHVIGRVVAVVRRI